MPHNENGGSIVSMASTRALMSEPFTEAYAATNCISPGWIETGDYEGLCTIDHSQHLSGRIGMLADIA